MYTVIPIISSSNDLNKPYLVLSRSILVSKYSNYKEIHRFIFSRYNETLKDFGMNRYNNFHVILKFKRVKFDINQVKRKMNL